MPHYVFHVQQKLKNAALREQWCPPTLLLETYSTFLHVLTSTQTEIIQSIRASKGSIKLDLRAGLQLDPVQ